jgi:lipoprotein-releasing system permease protein
VGLSSFISKRYFFSKSKWNVVNIISQVASFVLVIAICAFFVVLSVFSGLKNFGLNYSKAFDPDIKISHAKSKHFDLSTLPLNKLAALSEIKTFSKIIEEKVLLANQDKNSYGFLTGVDEKYNSVVEIDSLLILGRWISQELNDVAVSMEVADNLSLGLFNSEDGLTVLVPLIKSNSGLISSSFRSSFFMPTGVFRSSDEKDLKHVFTSIESARTLLRIGNETVSGIIIKTTDDTNNINLSAKIKTLLGSSFLVKTKEELNETYYKMLKAEGLILNLLMGLILIVAMFNTVGAVIILVIEKQENVKTLYKIGATKRQIQSVFFKHGLLLSFSGGLVGLFLGCLIVFLQESYGFVLLSGTSIPYPVSFESQNFFLVILWLILVSVIGSYLASLASKKITL